MSSKISAWLFIFLIFPAILSSCTASTADCTQDSDCPNGQHCASAGGVFFDGGICINKDTDTRDASTGVSDTSPDTAPPSDTTFVDVPSDHKDPDVRTDHTDIAESDAEDFDTAPPAECVNDEQCPSPADELWGECKFELPCDTQGLQKRDVRTAACENNYCTTHTTTEEQACTRETDKLACGQSTSGDWSECSFDGKKTRQTYSPTCKNSECSTVVSNEEVQCSCTDNKSCGDVTHGQWGNCTFADTCASTGTQAREVRTPACSNSSCSIVISSQNQVCTRDSTQGQSCGSTTDSGWSTCANQNVCATSGTQTRQVHKPTCQSNSCTTSTTTESQNCSLTPANTCGTATYSQWTTCSFENSCSNSGTYSRTKTTPTCKNGTCSGVNTTETAACGTRNTNGIDCGPPKQISFGKCSYVETCDQEGDSPPQNFSVPVCAAGNCSDERIETLYLNCRRNTNGAPCGGKNKAFCNHGCCGICQ